jgi:hypothetical protein
LAVLDLKIDLGHLLLDQRNVFADKIGVELHQNIPLAHHGTFHHVMAFDQTAGLRRDPGLLIEIDNTHQHGGGGQLLFEHRGHGNARRRGLLGRSSAETQNDEQYSCKPAHGSLL